MSNTPLADAIRDLADNLATDCALAQDYVDKFYTLAQQVGEFERSNT